MTEVETALADNRAAVDEFVATARAIDGARWQTPRAAGAWSPGQIVEHLAKTYEYNRDVVKGTAKGLPVPFNLLLKSLLRKIALTDTLKAGRFTRRGKAPAPFRPGPTPAPQPDLIARLSAAVSGLEAD